MKLPDYILVFIILLSLTLSFGFGRGLDNLIGIGATAFEYLLRAGPWILLGFFLGGLSQEFIPKEIFVRELGGTGPKTCLKAGVLGILVDVCSHGALAIGVSLYRSGASVAAVTSFLLATPWLGLMETSLLIGFLGVRITAVMAVVSFTVAILTGSIIGVLERGKRIDTHKEPPKKVPGNTLRELKEKFRGFEWKTFPKRLKSSLSHSFELFGMIWNWLLIGFIAAGITLTFVSPEMIEGLMGYASQTALPVTLVMASVIEICSEGSVPLAAAFYNMGASVGAIFVFLMAGVSSDITEIGTIASVIGKRTAVAIVGISITLTLVFAQMVNVLWIGMGWV